MSKVNKVGAGSSRDSTALTAGRYAELKRDVQASADTAERVSNHAKVQAFYRLGRRIARERLKLKSGYHNAVLRDLSTDTRMSLRNLQYAVAFVGAYKSVPARGLSWAHYRILLDRPDDDSRAHYETIARNETLSSPQLVDRIRSDVRKSSNEPALSRPTHACDVWGTVLPCCHLVVATIHKPYSPYRSGALSRRSMRSQQFPWGRCANLICADP